VYNKKMRWLLSILIIIFIFGCGDIENTTNGDRANTAWVNARGAEYVEGEVLVKFKEDPLGVRSASLHRAIGARLRERFHHIGGIEHIELPAGLSVKDAIKLYSQDPMVEFVEPNYKVYKAIIANDTYFGEQWGLNNTGQNILGINGTSDADIDAPEAWDIHTGASNTIVAVIDTGVDYTHPDLSSNIWQNPQECALSNSTNGVDDDGNGFTDDCYGWNFAYGNNNPMDDDNDCEVTPPVPMGHGSHVAGIIGAIGNNASGVSGLNWDIKIMPLKFLDSCGNGTISSAISAINYAVMMKGKGHNIRAINASYGGYYGGSQSESSAISTAGASGILFIAAAGNDGSDNNISRFYPASYNLPNMIAVSASDNKDQRAWFSNYGSESVHLFAPGLYILSTLRCDPYYPGCPWGYLSGTSMATPFVTGLSALVSSYKPSLSSAEVREIILSTVDKKPSFSNITKTGGRINAHSALLLANTPEAIIMPPSGVSASLNNSSVSISWTDNSGNEEFFEVEKKLGLCGTYSNMTNTSGTSAVDTSLEEGAIYYYQVLAVNSAYSGMPNNGRSSPSQASNPITITLPAPDELKVDSITSSSINISWRDNSTKETGFIVKRKTSSETSWSNIATLSANTTTYSDTNFLTGVLYDYKVVAYRSICSTNTYSSDSNIVSAKSGGSSGGGGGGCFIATAAYGSYLSPEVKTLREFRDNYLLKSPLGRSFVSAYYKISPPIAEFISRYESLRLITRLALTPLVYSIKYPYIALIAILGGLCLISIRRHPYYPPSRAE